MTDLELTRSANDRRVYILDGVGTLRLEGLFSRTATAEAAGQSWRFAQNGLWKRSADATDETGSTVGQFEPRGLRRGGTVRWAGRALTLQPASAWRDR